MRSNSYPLIHLKDEHKHILMLSYYSYPCSHPVLKNIFAKEVGKIASINWIFRTEEDDLQDKWENSDLILVRSYKRKNFITAIGNKIIEWMILFKTVGLIHSLKIQIVFIRDLPLHAIMLAPLKFILNFKLYFQYSAPQGDIYYDYSKKASGIKKYWYYLYGKAFNFLIEKALRSADIIFPISEFHQKELNQKIHGKKMIPITMGVEKKWITAKVNPIENFSRIKENYQIVTYFGSLSYSRNPDFIIEAFAKTNKKIGNIKLLLIGGGTEGSEMIYIKNVCHEFGVLRDVIFTGRINRTKVKDHLQYADLSISPIPPLQHYIISSPTKIYESLGCGVPVVANSEILEQKKVVNESFGGLLVDYDTDQFCDAMCRLLKNPKLRRAMSERGKRYIENNYTYEVMAQKLLPYFL